MLNACLLYFALMNIINAQQQTDTLVIHFDINKSIVDDINAINLNEFIVNKDVTSISIYGYTDFLGSVAYNQQLSEQRSINTRNYLIYRGIKRENIVISEGHGIHPNSKEENRQDLSDKGIKDHRIVKVIFTTNLQNFTAQEETLEERIWEESLVVNNYIVLENILFYAGSSRFRPESYRDLDGLLKIMQKHHSLKIEIHGHVCCITDNQHETIGLPASIGRANAVYEFLVNNGIDPTRLSYKGFGATRRRYPRESNEQERAMNRRVEILILEI